MVGGGLGQYAPGEPAVDVPPTVLPTDLTRRVHGWPELRGPDLIRTRPSHCDEHFARPVARARIHAHRTRSALGRTASRRPRRHPRHRADLARCAELGITAVVSLSRVGGADIAKAGVRSDKHAEAWLIDSERPDDNAHLAWTLADAARTVGQLRDDGERVLLHCVGALHRTPAVALAYAHLRGQDTETAMTQLEATFNRVGEGLLWGTAAELTPLTI